MTLKVASDTFQNAPLSQGLRPGKRFRSPSGPPIPAGVFHAYRPDATATLCNRPLDRLYPWPNYDWPWKRSRNAQPCSECQTAVQTSDSEAAPPPRD